MTVTRAKTVTPVRRPRDRKAQIAAAAAQLFRDRGFHGVAIEDIAAAVGITGRAIYRHFANKQDVLAQILFDGIAQLHEAAMSATTLDGATAGLVRVTLDRRELGVLIQRETRNLEDAEQQQVAQRVDVITDHMVELLRRERPDLHHDAARAVVRSAGAVLASPSQHHAAVPAPEALLETMTRAAFAAPVRAGSPRPHDAPVPRASRREAVLAGAAELFAQRGYGAVRMEDVGAAAGIAGPSIYEHFGSKAELLMAALTRGSEGLQLGLTGAIQPGLEPVEILERVVRAYAEFTLQHRDLMGVLVRESLHLPADEQTALRRLQHQYVSEWVRLVSACRPELTDPEAWFVTHGGLAVINDATESQLQYDLVPLSLAVLLEGER